jgi:hypothetical protein
MNIPLLFLIVVSLFAIVAWVYVWQNNFAKETIDVLYPAFGAVLVSVYLGAKLVVVDSPEPLKFSTTAVLITDPQTADFTALGGAITRFTNGEFSGLWKLDSLRHEGPLHDWFAKRTPAAPAYFDIVEYALIRWLSASEQQIGYLPQVPVTFLSGTIGGQLPSTSDPLFPVVVPAVSEMLRASPVEIALPAGSKIDYSRTPGLRGELHIETPRSRATFSVTYRGLSRIEPPRTAADMQVFAALGVHPGLYTFGYQIDADIQQRAFWRFSKQARVEEAWSRGLGERFENGFSWDRLRAALRQ